ncbi:MAG TPA: hypothetical protein VN675_08725 [Burkholderiales bacterium]|nr:hypothetical protein [Burkholderiales bacterium]
MAARTSALVILSLLLAGCAAMTEGECRSADWYKTGYRDADPYGLQPQFYVYEHQCHAWVQASQADYMRGWVDGYREFNTRMTGSECCR